MKIAFVTIAYRIDPNDSNLYTDLFYDTFKEKRSNSILGLDR